MTLDELQLKVKKFVDEKNIGTNIESRMIDLLSEAGELSKELLKSTDYGKKDFETTPLFKNELGDVFFSLISLANQSDISLQQVIEEAFIKYEKRFIDHQHIGSVDKK